MAVIIDSEDCAAECTGAKTVGEVLDSIRANGQMVVQILIDGQQPDLDDLTTLRGVGLEGRTVFIETAQPIVLAREAIQGLEDSVEDIDGLRLKAIAHLQENQPQLAVQSLSALFTTWHTAQLCVNRVAELAGIRLATVLVADKDVLSVFASFTNVLREIRLALQNRDYVLLGDMLRYDLEDAGHKWRGIVSAVGQVPWIKAA